MKAVGLILIFFAFSLSGAALSSHKKRTIEYTEGLLALVCHIRYRIKYFGSEITDIYNSFSNDFLSKIGFTDYLLVSSLEEAIVRFSKIYDIPRFEYGELIGFSAKLGKTETENQLTLCDSLCETLTAYADTLRKKYPDERKLLISLGILAGLLSTVILF